jgi:hypothetical protein
MLSASSASAWSVGSGMGTLLQSAADVNIIFVNIDWKASRHANAVSTRRNLAKLWKTTCSIVTKMNPAVICCCEVGEAMNPMKSEHMSEIVGTMRKAWEVSCVEHPVISFHFEDQAPYLTIWDDNRCKCKRLRILDNVYYVSGHQRKAQAFLCIRPGENDDEGIDVINVHAPSGKPQLTDKQRHSLVRNLLQSGSMVRANKQIGECRFLFGGDMNTNELTHSVILNKLRSEGVLKRNTQVLFPTWAKPGDICVVGGFKTRLVPARACNHDPRHEPYGIVWQKQPQPATEQLTTTPQTQILARESGHHCPSCGRSWRAGDPNLPHQGICDRAICGRQELQDGVLGASRPSSSSRGNTTATEQPQPVIPEVELCSQRHPSQLPQEEASASTGPVTEQSDRQGEIGTPRFDSRRSLPQLKECYPTELHATEQQDEPVEIIAIEHGTDAGVVHTQTEAEIPQSTTEHSQFDTEEQLTPRGLDLMDITRHATEQSRLTEPEQEPNGANEPPALNGPEQELAYVIVNAFLDGATFDSSEAEGMIKRIILNTSCWSPDMFQNIDEVFRPIFFNYPNGLSDRTVAEPRDASQYIRHWRERAQERGCVLECVRLIEPTGSQLEEPQVQMLFNRYVDNFIENEADVRQRAQAWNRNKSRAEARLRRLCGSTMMANAIWRLGLPEVAEATSATEKVLDALEPATEQQLRLGPGVPHSIAIATESILTWLNMLAESIQSHKATPGYQEHARKSGTHKNQSGLNATEREAKEEKKRLARLKYGCKSKTNDSPLPQWRQR